MFELRGTAAQNREVSQALAKCDFPWARMTDSLRREGKSTIAVDWQDLSRFAGSEPGAHSHVHDGDAVAHPIERVVDGRRRVLGLFYLPPYTRIVLDTSLLARPLVAQEVFLAEGAHAVDYHYMQNPHRIAVVNALHTQSLPDTFLVRDGIPITLDGHTCSWFDVNTYAWWCGESFMEAFCRAFAPSVPVTIKLAHRLENLGVERIRYTLIGPDLFGTRLGHAFHLDTCPFIRASWRMHKTTWATPEDAALAGRRPCRVCRPPVTSW